MPAQPRKTINVIIGCLLTFAALGQRFENLNAQFPMSLSEEIYQDGYGFIWIGTVDGLVKLDGYSATYYSNDPNDSLSLRNNNINAIIEDQYGRMWIGLGLAGINILDRSSREFTNICIPGDPDDCQTKISVNDFALDSEGKMWAGTSKGLFYTRKEDPADITLLPFPGDSSSEQQLSSDYILKLYIDAKNRLWVGTADGINLIDLKDNSIIRFSSTEPLETKQILDITESPDGTVVVCPRNSFSKLFYFNESTMELEGSDILASERRGAFRIDFDHSDNMWISSRGEGAYYYNTNKNSLRFFAPANAWLHGFRNVYPLTCREDKYGNTWILGSNVLKWPGSNKAFNQISSDEFLVISIYADEDKIWFCGSELRRLDRATDVLESAWPDHSPTNLRGGLPNVLAAQRVYTMTDLDENRIVVSTTRNMYLWDKRTDEFTEIATSWGGPFRDFLLLSDKTHVVISGNQGPPILLNLNTFEHFNHPGMLSVKSPHAIAQDSAGNIWVGSLGYGVYKYDPVDSSVTQFSPENQDTTTRLSSFNVNDIHVDKENNVWIGTSFGLNKYDPTTGRITRIRKQHGFPNDHVASILEDDRNNLWLGTQQGLSRYNKASGSFEHFNKSDGLINGIYSPRSCYRDRQGTLYFGGDLGVDYFDPTEIGINSIPPDVYVSRILVNNDPFDPGIPLEEIQSITLDHTQKFIEIELLALHLTAPASNQYAYQIPEISEDWIFKGTRRNISLTNMRPGAYNLNVKASNADGVWSEEKSLLRITIKPPFWLTWWFISILSAMAAAILYAAYRYRINQVRTRERLKADFNQRIAELESKALRAQMNPHFLFNSLNSLKSLISQGEAEKATQYLTRFAQLIRQVLANSEQQTVRLQEELEALRLYLEIEQLRFQNFEFHIDVADSIDTDFVEVPPLILQPYVENAIWHGLMHKTDGNRNVQVEVKRDNGYLLMSVTDNGIGREQAGTIAMRGSSRKGGMGMRLTGDRLSLLHGVYGKTASVSVEDLHDRNGKPIGTRVIISIPYSE